MLKTNQTKNTYLFIKDQDNNYVAGHSIDYYKDTKQVVYAYSKFLTNGFYFNATLEGAKQELELLQTSQKRFKLEKQFHIEQISDIRSVLLEEKKFGETKVGLSSIQHEYFEFDDGKEYVWVIKDNQGNFANSNSIRKTEKNIMTYVSYKTFSQGCREYSSLQRAQDFLHCLYHKNMYRNKRIFDVNFHLEYHDLLELIEEDYTFQGRSIIFVEKQVA